MAKRKLTEVEKAYNKELRRLQSFIKKKEQIGFQFSSKAIPKKPKKITKASVRRLAKISTESLYNKAVYGGEATEGELVSGEAGRIAELKLQKERRKEKRQQKKQREQPPAQRNNYSTPDNVSGDSSFFDYMVINEYRRNIAHFGNKAYAELGSWLDNLTSQYGEHAVAEMLEDGASSGTVVTYQIAYDDSKLQDYMSDMFDYLEFGADYRAGISDAFDEDSNFDTY